MLLLILLLLCNRNRYERIGGRNGLWWLVLVFKLDMTVVLGAVVVVAVVGVVDVLEKAKNDGENGEEAPARLHIRALSPHPPQSQLSWYASG